jgi:hypothetical protein
MISEASELNNFRRADTVQLSKYIWWDEDQLHRPAHYQPENLIGKWFLH